MIRNLHRDLGYFYVGLIISFAFSGILMNHREMWHPEKYTVSETTFQTKPIAENTITEDYAISLLKTNGFEDKIRRFKVKDNQLKVSFEKHDIELNIKTGNGTITAFHKTPIISQSMKLHKSTSNYWIYYSDIFGLSLITIAITGMLIVRAGKFSYKARGWKLTLAGLVIPIIVLFLLS